MTKVKLNKNSLKKLIQKDTSNIRSVVELLNKNEIKIIFIINSKNKLIGTISDGDLRRGLLKGLTFSDKAQNLMEKNYHFVYSNVEEEKANEILNTNQINYLPILNRKKELVGIHKLDIFEKKINESNPIVIMAGGFGKRLMPITKTLPKSMVRIGEKPLLETIILKAKEEGFRKIYISVYYKAKVIEKYFGNGEKFGVNIEYIREKKPLGTIGSLSLIKNKFSSDFIVINCDILTDINLKNIIQYHKKTKSALTVAYKKYELQNPYGVLKIKGHRIKSFSEKPVIESNINAGIYAFSNKVLKLIKSNSYFDFPELLEILFSKNEKVTGFPIYESWIDVGNKNDLNLAKKIHSD